MPAPVEAVDPVVHGLAVIYFDVFRFRELAHLTPDSVLEEDDPVVGNDVETGGCLGTFPLPGTVVINVSCSGPVRKFVSTIVVVNGMLLKTRTSICLSS